jgi:hypothetical protein
MKLIGGLASLALINMSLKNVGYRSSMLSIYFIAQHVYICTL